MEKIKFDFDDILIEPAIQSDIKSRKGLIINDGNGMLPLFTAPMDTVVDLSNYKIFIENGINVVLPRTINDLPYGENNYNLWFSYGLTEFDDLFINSSFIRDKMDEHNLEKFYVLIDIANGHQTSLRDSIIKSKEIYNDNLVLMVGNVANAETYKILSDAGADKIRIGIGNGGGCLTTQQLGVGYPMGSLIKECYDISCSLNNPAKIIADGGFKKYSDIIKGLAIGSDSIMVGSIFNKSIESCADTYISNDDHGTWKTPGEKVDQYSEEVKRSFNFGTKYYKMFRGMSTKEAQKSMGKSDLKTSEGIVRLNEVEYTLHGWVDNFESYLRSAMSYTDKIKIEYFIGGVKFNLITQNAFSRFNK